MKEIQTAIGVLEAKLHKRHEDRVAVDRDIYILEQSIEAIRRAQGLRRIRRVKHEKKCMACGKEFRAKTTLADYCSKECQRKAARKGVTLLKGDAVKAS